MTGLMQPATRVRSSRGRQGAALIEYVLILPLVLLLFLGTLEILRLISVKQSLRSALRLALPYYTHWKDTAGHIYYPAPQQIVQNELAKNPFVVHLNRLTITPSEAELNAYTHGQVFEVVVEAEVPLGFVSFLSAGGRPIVLRETYETFIDSSPEFLELNVETPFPKEPEH